jgi:hypothetical protein
MAMRGVTCKASRFLQKPQEARRWTQGVCGKICWRIKVSLIPRLLMWPAYTVGVAARPHNALGQVAPFGTADKAPYQPWLFVMQAAKNSSLPAKNLPSLR